MIVEIDPKAGFCTGVVNAIKKVEEELARGVLYCIGDIVHNHLEVQRLNEKGLITIDHTEFENLKNCRVLFRAHGEPPVSYEIARKNNIEVIDASCSVVLSLQKRIRDAYEQLKESGGKVVIFGKKGHAEVIGLVGQTNGEAIVIESEEDALSLDFTKPIVLFSQTTKNLDTFQSISDIIRKKGGDKVVVHDTICRKVANRIPELSDFATRHDMILFVSGEKSSNGKQLYDVCKKVNRNTYFIHGMDDLDREMFAGVHSVGISGATSTPLWIMKQIKDKIESYGM